MKVDKTLTPVEKIQLKVGMKAVRAMFDDCPEWDKEKRFDMLRELRLMIQKYMRGDK